jgi:hypothetical protein
MRYEVTERFYDQLVALVGIAIEDNNPAEIDLAYGIIKDTAMGQEN